MWLILLFNEHYGKIKKYANTLLCLVYTYIEVSFRIIVYCLLGAATVDSLAYWHQEDDRSSLVEVDFVLKVMTREFHVYSYVGSAQFIKKIIVCPLFGVRFLSSRGFRNFPLAIETISEKKSLGWRELKAQIFRRKSLVRQSMTVGGSVSRETLFPLSQRQRCPSCITTSWRYVYTY